jgi:hypothetical protein
MIVDKNKPVDKNSISSDTSWQSILLWYNWCRIPQ